VGRGSIAAPARGRALASRVSTGHVVMVLAGVLGALLTLSAVRSADHTRPMLAAARDIPPGTVITADELRVTRVHVATDVASTLLDASAEADARGHVALERIPAGALVTRAAVRESTHGAAPRAMSFPIPRSRAVGGALGAGDRVDVLAVTRNTGRSGYVATDAAVLAFSSRDSGPLQDSGDASVTLAVDAAAAARIASALETGTITLVRATGAAPLHLAQPFDPAGASTNTAAAGIGAPS